MGNSPLQSSSAPVERPAPSGPTERPRGRSGAWGQLLVAEMCGWPDVTRMEPTDRVRCRAVFPQPPAQQRRLSGHL